MEDCKCMHKHDNKINNIKIDENKIKKLESFYSALSTASRLKILTCLAECPMCVCELARALNMTKSAVSHQLSYLKKLGLVKGEKLGKEVMYTLTDNHIEQILQIAISHVSEDRE